MWLLLLFVPLAGAAPTEVPFKEAAEYLSKAVNLSVDPCDDFYEFACGGWVASHEISPDRIAVSPISVLEDKVEVEIQALLEANEPHPSVTINQVRGYYKKCTAVSFLDDDEGRYVLQAAKKVSHWPFLDAGGWDPKKFDLTHMLALVHKRDASPFLKIDVSTDSLDTDKRIIVLDQGKLGLDTGHAAALHYYIDANYSKQLDDYRKYVFDIMSMIAEDANVMVKNETLEKEVKEHIDLEVSLAKIFVPAEERRNHTRLHNIRKLSQLKEYMPMIDWPRLFKETAPTEVHPYFDADPELNVKEIEFMKKLNDLLNATDPRIITNYVLFRYSEAFIMEADTRHVARHQALIRKLYGRARKPDRWKECIFETARKMPHATGSLYVRDYFPETAKAKLEMVVDAIKRSFVDLLNENDWMDAETKKQALKKAADMLCITGYPEWIVDNRELDNFYTKLNIHPTETFFEQSRQVVEWRHDLQYEQLMQNLHRKDFHKVIDFPAASIVNAFYAGDSNAIILSAAFLRPHFFSADYPMWFNFGAVGSIIGHEITHGFDDIGNQHDHTGKLENWWHGDTRKNFAERAKCIIDQYSAEEVEEVGMKLNGVRTQGENIADNGGLKQAYRSYMRWANESGVKEPALTGFEKYTNEQLFFIAHAQNTCAKVNDQALRYAVLTNPHPPGKQRTNVVLSNLKEFAKAFNCPLGSRMNPKKRCGVW